MGTDRCSSSRHCIMLFLESKLDIYGLEFSVCIPEQNKYNLKGKGG